VAAAVEYAENISRGGAVAAMAEAVTAAADEVEPDR